MHSIQFLIPKLDQQLLTQHGPERRIQKYVCGHSLADPMKTSSFFSEQELGHFTVLKTLYYTVKP